MMDARILKAFLLGLLVVVVLTLLGLHYVWQVYRVVQVGTQIAAATKRLERLQTDHELLRGEYHTLRARQNVTEKAEQLLRMHLPTERDTRHVPAPVSAAPVLLLPHAAGQGVLLADGEETP